MSTPFIVLLVGITLFSILLIGTLMLFDAWETDNSSRSEQPQDKPFRTDPRRADRQVDQIIQEAFREMLDAARQQPHI